ncbi:hypothetical protein WR25_26677 [Diploscapter pachys]|uniref:Kinetochore protein NDC80 n=1 Tax=Diploscapter pachys TaxID=2018661 RepID=A0A2A2J8Y6_9BILA|nr:hypothetical protein WR25_26677 [Diploscapter pachys]
MSKTPKRPYGLGTGQGMKTPVMRHSSILPPSASRTQAAGRLTIADASMRRTSTLFQPTTATKLPRDLISSHSYKQDMVAKIWNFINKYEQDAGISPEMILAPTSNVFRDIFEMIYSHLSVDYESPKNIQEFSAQFVRIMEELGFPVAIKGSTMMTIGVATSYPLLLAALGWLVDTVTAYKAIHDKSHLMMRDDEGGQKGVVRYSFLHQAFKEYKQNRNIVNEPDYQQKCEEKIKSIYEDTENFEEQEKALTATLARLDENLEEKRNHNAQLHQEIAKAELEIDKMNEDMAQIVDVLQVTRKEMDKATKNLECVASEREKAERSLAQKKEELERVNQAIREQAEGENGIRRGEAKQLRAEQQRLRTECQTLKEQCEKISKEQWNNSKKFDAIFGQQRDRLMDLHNRVMMLRGNLGEDTTQNIDLPRNNADLCRSVNVLGQILFDLDAMLRANIRKADAAISDLKATLSDLERKYEIARENLVRTEKDRERFWRRVQKEKEELRREREAREAEIGEFLIDDFCQPYLRKKPFSSAKK